MISDEQFTAWLKERRDTYTVLCDIRYNLEVGSPGNPGQETLRVATLAYTDSTNGRQYKDWIHELPSYSRDLTGDNFNNYASTIGTMVLNNADGRCDDFADAFVDGSEAAFYVGDTSWPISDFRVIFVATVTKISASTQEKLSVELRDSGILLNKSIGGEIRIGGEGPNADQFRPVNIGYVAQMEAILQDVGDRTYVYNDSGNGLWLGDTERVVRANGYPVEHDDNGDGSLTLATEPDGGATITTNVMATPAGDEANRLTSDMLDELIGVRAGLNDAGRYIGAQDTFEVGGDEDYPLGLSITEPRNLVEVLGEVCDSGLCFWAVSRLNEVFYGRLRPSYIDVLGVAPVATITADPVSKGSFSREPMDPRYYRLQVYVSQNWAIPSTTVSTDDSGDPRILTADELAVVTRKGLSVIQGVGVGNTYEAAPELYHKTLSESPAIETLLSDPDDEEGALVGAAWMEVARASQLPWLHVLTMTVPLEFYFLELGNVVTLEYPRFGYDAGVQAQVIGVDISLLSRMMTVRLLRRHVQGPYAGRETTPIASEPDTVLQLKIAPVVAQNTGVPPLPGLSGFGTSSMLPFTGAFASGSIFSCSSDWPTAQLEESADGIGCYALASGKNASDVDLVIIAPDDSLAGEFTLLSHPISAGRIMLVNFRFTPSSAFPNAGMALPNITKTATVTVTYSDASTESITVQATLDYATDGYLVIEPGATSNSPYGPPPTQFAQFSWSSSVPVDIFDNDASTTLPTQVITVDHEEDIVGNPGPRWWGPRFAIPAHHSEVDVTPLEMSFDNGGGTTFTATNVGGNFQQTTGIPYAEYWRVMVGATHWLIYTYRQGPSAGDHMFIGFVREGTDVPSTIGGDSMPPNQEPYPNPGDPFPGTLVNGGWYRTGPGDFIIP